jgi:predicted esterase
MGPFAGAIEGPHQGQPVLTAGMPAGRARAAMVMLHGRGATAEDILTLVGELDRPDFAYLAPQAAGYAWYPYSFFAPISRNEPWLSSALAVLATILMRLMEGGIAPERVILLGFSQGACLALEYAAGNARRYGGVVGLSGGLIGPEDAPRDYSGSLAGTPVFLGCSDVDPFIPKARVDLTAAVLERLGGAVTERIYPGMAHSVNQDEIAHVQRMMDTLVTDVKKEGI